MDVSAESGSARQAYDRMRAAYLKDGPLPLKLRHKLLRAIERAISVRKDELVSAVSADFRGRAPSEIFRAELMTTYSAARHARSHLKEWVQPEPIELPTLFRPGRARIEYQPLGVVGIISPWCDPIRLSITPLISAIAAGNRVILKPSELTPQTSALLSSMLPDVLGSDNVAVVYGGPELGAAVSALPLDHLLFTGSASVGRKVLSAASTNLTPVTLAVGGCSPALVHDSYSIPKAAQRIMLGKLAGAGQTGLAPDYVLCPADKVDAFVKAFSASAAKRYPTLAANEGYTAIINRAHRERLSALVSAATGAGATAHEINPGSEDLSASPKMAPVLLTGVPEDAEVLRAELLGPVLPIVPYTSLPDAIRYVNERPPPLRLYYFDSSRRRARELVERTASGSVTSNFVLASGAQHLLSVGGENGGFAGFETFSHRKPIHEVGRLTLLPIFQRPALARLVRALMRLLMV